MTTNQIDLPNSPQTLRVWPGVVAAAVLWLAIFGAPTVAPEIAMYSVMFGGLSGMLAFIVWWMFFSRAPRIERWGGFAVIIAALVATRLLLHKSIATGMMGAMFFFYAIPVTCLAFVLWAVVCRRMAARPRRVAMVATILLACGAFLLLRTDGMTGAGDSQFAWRWSATAEERLLAQTDDPPALPPSAPAVVETPATIETTKEQVMAKSEDRAAAPAPAVAERRAEWPGFRGANRDGVIRGARIKTDWSASPPVELWRQSVGPGWSSFAVSGDLFYTQEQRGNDEVVSCYNVTTGKLVWRHRDQVRFWESNAGPGPRATPTISNGRVYTLGATGILNALDARNGSVVWSRNAASDTGAKLPDWGFAGSPLVFSNMVIVATAGKLIAYDIATGKPRWFGPDGGAGYSSPHLASLGGVTQILLLNGSGAIGVAPNDGKLLWEHRWSSDGIVQPALTADGDILIGSGSGISGVGLRRISVGRSAGEWAVEERWTSNGLKPYYNDFVVHKGHAFGFDGSILACVNLADGKRKWKGGRYGHGQLVLLHDQDLLLALSEEGELALVSATPDQFTELARFKAIEGKTWNHPALAGEILLTRNGEQMAAFRLPVSDR